MKYKLSYKFFAVFSLTSLTIVALMVGLIRFSVARNFADYANKSMLEEYRAVATALATEYQTQKGWQRLKNNPVLWEEIVQSNMPLPGIEKRRPHEWCSRCTAARFSPAY